MPCSAYARCFEALTWRSGAGPRPARTLMKAAMPSAPPSRAATLSLSSAKNRGQREECRREDDTGAETRSTPKGGCMESLLAGMGPRSGAGDCGKTSGRHPCTRAASIWMSLNVPWDSGRKLRGSGDPGCCRPGAALDPGWRALRERIRGFQTAGNIQPDPGAQVNPTLGDSRQEGRNACSRSMRCRRVPMHLGTCSLCMHEHAHSRMNWSLTHE